MSGCHFLTNSLYFFLALAGVADMEIPSTFLAACNSSGVHPDLSKLIFHAPDYCFFYGIYTKPADLFCSFFACPSGFFALCHWASACRAFSLIAGLPSNMGSLIITGSANTYSPWPCCKLTACSSSSTALLHWSRSISLWHYIVTSMNFYCFSVN